MMSLLAIFCINLKLIRWGDEMIENILITGAKGFIGRNLIQNLKTKDKYNIYEFDKENDLSTLESYCQKCSFVYHLAGVNRPISEHEYMEGNGEFTKKLLYLLQKNNNTCPVMFASSIQAESNNLYGLSKKEGEDAVKNYGHASGASIYIYRFPNLFGKWSRPNYNSVVATFCNNIARGMDININDPNSNIKLAYIDDVILELVSLLHSDKHDGMKDYYEISLIYDTTIGQLAKIISSFAKTRETKELPYTAENSLEKKLYSTYLSYLPSQEFSYPLEMNADDRGSFTEIFRIKDRGQVSVNISKPGIEKGNHWHNTKCEKFCVVSGKALIQLRLPDSDTIISYHVTGDNIEVVDIPCGYTHNIINEGDTDLITIMWCNEYFNPEQPDTYFCKVNI